VIAEVGDFTRSALHRDNGDLEAVGLAFRLGALQGSDSLRGDQESLLLEGARSTAFFMGLNGLIIAPLVSCVDELRDLSAKLSVRGAALSTVSILLRDIGHGISAWDRAVIDIRPAAKD
jgi:hypothetical protein